MLKSNPKSRVSQLSEAVFVFIFQVSQTEKANAQPTR